MITYEHMIEVSPVALATGFSYTWYNSKYLPANLRGTPMNNPTFGCYCLNIHCAVIKKTELVSVLISLSALEVTAMKSVKAGLSYG